MDLVRLSFAFTNRGCPSLVKTLSKPLHICVFPSLRLNSTAWLRQKIFLLAGFYKHVATTARKPL
jgi:hypothetical protein